LPGASREFAATRRIYQRHFAFDAYCQSLWAIVGRLVKT
jgi:hypothetical protein